MVIALIRLNIVLALVVEIVRGDGCTLGRLPLSPISPYAVPGLYIDKDNSASCNGQITRWRICYYNPRIFSIRNSLQILLQTWRLKNNHIARIGSYSTTLDIPQQPDDFQCVNINPDPADYIDVEQGDYIAVYTFKNAVLPVIPNITDGSDLYFYPTSLSLPKHIRLRMNPQLVTLPDKAIHVSATIVNPSSEITPEVMDTTSPNTLPTQKTNSPSTTKVNPSSEITPEVMDTTSPNTLPTQKTNSPSTTKEVIEISTGLDSRAVVAVVIVLLAVIAVTLLAVVSILFYVRTRRKAKKEENSAFTIDNATYDILDLHKDSDTIKYNNTSMASSYEVPIRTIKRTSNEQRDHVEVNGTLNTGFVDSSFEESQTISHGTDEGSNGLGNDINPYATLSPTVLRDYYNTFLKEQETTEIDPFFNNQTTLSTADHIYTLPDMQAEAHYSEPPNNEEDIYKELFKRAHTINRKSIKIITKIGGGAFSTVSKGSWSEGSSQHDVAVKELIKRSKETHKIKMLQEAAILGQFRHPNIVKLFGVVKHGSAPMIVTEYLHKSDLLNVLLSIAPGHGKLVAANTPDLLLSYSQQVCLGMHYLASKGFVHRDLAARNIFVTKNDICKVGDFGLSRELANTDYYVSHGGMVPVRWTAPEAIFYHKHSSASDVWSYGCLLYEIWTLGMKPYDGIETSKYLETLQAGYRLPPPPGCPLVIYKTMIECWNPQANKRPCFGYILSILLNEKENILSIPIIDASTHLQASQLGASLEAGLEMYKDLQNTYLKKEPNLKQEHSSSRDTQKISQSTLIPAKAEEKLYETVCPLNENV